jgi:hypothetical protein
LSTLQREQKIAYEKESEKMRQKRFVLNSGRAFYWYPYFCISFYTRMMAMEVCFGDVDEEEPNIAYSILSSVMKVSQPKES